MNTPLIPSQSPSARAEAEAAFRAYARRTRTDGAGGDHVISATNEARIVGLWGAACDALRLGAEDDVVPSIPDLWRVKSGMGAAEGLARRVPDDAPGCARRVLRIVYGYTGNNNQLGRDGGSLVPAAFKPLLAYDDGSEAQPNAHLAVLARVVRHVAPEQKAPRVLPDVRRLYAAAETLPSPEKRGTISAAVQCYRRLRARAVAADPDNAARFALLADPRRTQGRGFIKVLAESSDPADRALGMAGDLKAALRKKAPLLYKQMEEFAERPTGVKGQTLSVAYADDMWDVAGGIAAILYVHRPTEPGTFELDQLWMSTVAMTPEVAGVDARNAKYLRAGEQTVSVLLARWLVDRLACESRRLTGATSGYPAAIVGEVTQWWTLTARFHAQQLSKIAPTVWSDWKREYGVLRDHLRANPVPVDAATEKASRERMMLVSLPLLWCVGLPLLGREAERLLDRLESLSRAARAAGHSAPLMTESVSKARREFGEKAEAYIATALPWIDTMRRAQYQHGRYGTHFVPGFNERGRVIALHCNWSGKRMDRARVKQGTKGSRVYGPGLINLRVFMGYIEHVRAPRLVRLGAVPEEAAAPNGQWPLFVSPDATSLDHCALSESTLRVWRYGATLYRITTEILGHRLEPNESLDRAGKWKGAWGQHEVREDAATIVGHHMGMWERACAMTMDTVDVLKKRYLVGDFHPVGEPGEWRCTETFFPHVRALLDNPRRAPSPLDDPELPLPRGARAMLEQWAEEDAARARKARQSKHGVADAHLRGPRPDVAERNRRRASLSSRAGSRVSRSGPSAITGGPLLVTGRPIACGHVKPRVERAPTGPGTVARQSTTRHSEGGQMVPLLSDAPRAVGVYAQSLRAAVLTRLGYQLAKPMGATLPFDLLASRDMRSWLTIQVKQAGRDGTVGLRRGDKKAGCKSYVAGDFDALLVVDLLAGAFLIPYAAIQRYRSRVCVRDARCAEFRVAEPRAELRRRDGTGAATEIRSTPQLSLFTARAA